MKYVDIIYKTPLYIATEEGDSEIVKLLLSHSDIQVNNESILKHIIYFYIISKQISFLCQYFNKYCSIKFQIYIIYLCNFNVIYFYQISIVSILIKFHF